MPPLSRLQADPSLVYVLPGCLDTREAFSLDLAFTRLFKFRVPSRPQLYQLMSSTTALALLPLLYIHCLECSWWLNKYSLLQHARNKWMPPPLGIAEME